MPKPAPLDIEVSREIAAAPTAVWDLVADVTRMGDWSPETTSAKWLGASAGPAVGARFKGRNQAGPNKWSTKPTVTACERGQVFGFKVPGAGETNWRYDFEPTADGTLVTESVVQSRPTPWFIRLLQKRAGIADRGADVRQKMVATLDNLAATAERSAPAQA